MDPYGKRELLFFYDRHLDKFGDTPQALRWTPEGQTLRYAALLEAAGPLEGREVLDFGCGKGDLCGFLKERGIEVRYCGLDVNENLLALARAKHPGEEFIALDIEEEPLKRTCDTVLICGVFNLRIAGIAASMRRALQRLFPLCRESLHMNIPSARTPRRDVEIFYADPVDLLAFARSELSPEATVREDLVKNEIFLSVWKEGAR